MLHQTDKNNSDKFTEQSKTENKNNVQNTNTFDKKSVDITQKTDSMKKEIGDASAKQEITLKANESNNIKETNKKEKNNNSDNIDISLDDVINEVINDNDTTETSKVTNKVTEKKSDNINKSEIDNHKNAEAVQNHKNEILKNKLPSIQQNKVLPDIH
jgi:hypothetical protein